MRGSTVRPRTPSNVRTPDCVSRRRKPARYGRTEGFTTRWPVKTAGAVNLVAHRFLGLHRRWGRRSLPTGVGSGRTSALRSCAADLARCGLCFVFGAYFGAYSARTRFCVGCASCRFSQTRRCCMAGAADLPTWGRCWRDRLRDGHLPRRRMARTLGGDALQYILSLLAVSRLAAHAARQAAPGAEMAAARYRRPPRDCDDAPGDGSLLRNQPYDPPRPEPVFRDRLLDRLFHQRNRDRAIASNWRSCPAFIAPSTCSPRSSECAPGIGRRLSNPHRLCPGCGR